MEPAVASVTRILDMERGRILLIRPTIRQDEGAAQNLSKSLIGGAQAGETRSRSLRSTLVMLFALPLKPVSSAFKQDLSA